MNTLQCFVLLEELTSADIIMFQNLTNRKLYFCHPPVAPCYSDESVLDVANTPQKSRLDVLTRAIEHTSDHSDSAHNFSY